MGDASSENMAVKKTENKHEKKKKQKMDFCFVENSNNEVVLEKNESKKLLRKCNFRNV